jgi:hypothetical protein
MAAPTSAVQKLQKILANLGPSTHGLQPKDEAAQGRERHLRDYGHGVAR